MPIPFKLPAVPISFTPLLRVIPAYTARSWMRASPTGHHPPPRTHHEREDEERCEPQPRYKKSDAP
eukprot:278381-Chlamydomonas_euryale.AAC.2